MRFAQCVFACATVTLVCLHLNNRMSHQRPLDTNSVPPPNWASTCQKHLNCIFIFLNSVDSRKPVQGERGLMIFPPIFCVKGVSHHFQTFLQSQQAESCPNTLPVCLRQTISPHHGFSPSSGGSVEQSSNAVDFLLKFRSFPISSVPQLCHSVFS